MQRTLIEYYEERYRQPPGAMRDYGAYLELLDLLPGERLLDVGCGEGFFLAEARRSGLEVVGIEIAQAALRLAREKVPAPLLARAAGESLPFARGTFQWVSCLGVLEHFSDPRAGVREIGRVLGPSGRALIVVPNRRFVGWLVRGTVGTEQQRVSELLLDLDEWRELLEGEGLRVMNVTKEPWHTKPFGAWPLRWLLRLAHVLIPRRWTYQFAFVCATEAPAR